MTLGVMFELQMRKPGALAWATRAALATMARRIPRSSTPPPATLRALGA